MKTVTEYTGFSVPDYALSYFVNGDASGLSDTDKYECDNWYSHFVKESSFYPDSQVLFTVHTDRESYFTWYPAFGLACTCYECTVYILVDGTDTIKE